MNDIELTIALRTKSVVLSATDCILGTIANKPNKTRRIRVEFDVVRLERLAANLGLFSPDFRRSLAAAERDVRLGKTRTVSSLRELAS